jgi:MazG family protein
MPQKKSKRKQSNKPKSSAPPRVGPAFDKLVAVMDRLRSPGGCPWDREQTHDTLRTYLIEEAYEVLDALESRDDTKFAEELGDLLLQVLFHAQIAREESRFSIAEVIREIHDKLIRRHPHVFGETHAKNSAEVLRNWEAIKLEERKRKAAKEGKQLTEIKDEPAPTSVLDGIPHALPALLEALQLTRKASRVGFDWDNIDGIFAKLEEETHELRQVLHGDTASRGTSTPAGAPSISASSSKKPNKDGGRSLSSDNKSPATKGASAPEPPPSSTIEGELGDILFVAVNLARFLHVDPEIALKKSSAKFSRRFRQMERQAQTQGTNFAKLPRPEMEALWNQAKQSELSNR